jgi:ATP-binding cassette subfamily B multidrug efflux pump
MSSQSQQAQKRNPLPQAFGFRMGPPPGMLGEGEKSRHTRSTLLRLWSYLKLQKWSLVGTGLLVVVSSGIDLLGPYLMGLAIDDFISKGNLPGLARLLLLMILTYLVASIGTWLQTYFMAGVSQRVVRDLRNDLFSRLQTLPLRYFDQKAHGDLMSRLTNDVENISNILSSSFSQLLSSTFGLVGVIIVMFALNYRLAFVSLVVMPLTFVLTRIISARIRQGYRETQQTLGNLNGIIEENVSGLKVVKAFVCSETTVDQFSVVNRRLQKVAFRARIFGGFMGPIMNMVNNLGFAIVACAGGWLAVEGLATVGEVAAFINYANRLGRPLNQIAQLFSSIQSALAGAERVFEVMDELPEQDAMDARSLEHVAGDVAFESVNFSYEVDVPVFAHSFLRCGQWCY